MEHRRVGVVEQGSARDQLHVQRRRLIDRAYQQVDDAGASREIVDESEPQLAGAGSIRAVWRGVYGDGR
jgi:hypothetical protein